MIGWSWLDALQAYWQYMHSPKGRYEWRGYCLVIGALLISVLLVILMVWKYEG